MYEPAACPWCACTGPEPRYPALHVVDCPQCGLRYTSPRLNGDGRAALYSQEYFRSDASHTLGYDNYEADRAHLLHTFRRRLRAVTAQAGRPGRLLDVGCATGIGVESARALGWEAEGIDLSEYAVTVGRERHGLSLHCAEIEQWRSALAPYDVVTMWDYIEHVPDPVPVLQAAYALLRPGGLLVVTTPDVGSLPARVFRERWMGYKRDEHLLYFTPTRLRAFLRTADFQPLFQHYVGKHINLGFFCNRLSDYTPRLARVLQAMVRGVRLHNAVLYVNPMDIICVTAQRPVGPPA